VDAANESNVKSNELVPFSEKYDAIELAMEEVTNIVKNTVVGIQKGPAKGFSIKTKRNETISYPINQDFLLSSP
jgi:hypothetical protein